ncbi:MAG: FAD binding domain-containing protein [Acidimicrobiaceae bacterium]|nr:FAD binding domain-containing protein [Acidimicrobiaceae bacterium]
MTVAELGFVKPGTLDEALAALARPGSMLLGGGTSIGILLKNRLIEPERLVWVGALAELSGISLDEDGAIRIGAAATLRDLARSELLQGAVPVLPDAAGRIGNPRVRAVATLGGALVHGDPRQDLPPVLLALRSQATIAAPGGTRTVGLDGFYLDFMEVALGEGEVVTDVLVPSRSGWRDRYSRFTPGSEDDYPTVGVAVSLRLGDGGLIDDAEIALGGVDSRPILATEAARSLIGTSGAGTALEEAARNAAGHCDPSDDARGSADYKRKMVDVWVRRTVAACLS